MIRRNPARACVWVLTPSSMKYLRSSALTTGSVESAPGIAAIAFSTILIAIACDFESASVCASLQSEVSRCGGLGGGLAVTSTGSMSISCPIMISAPRFIALPPLLCCGGVLVDQRAVGHQHALLRLGPRIPRIASARCLRSRSRFPRSPTQSSRPRIEIR